jgi:hypothetical protein
VVTSQIPPYSFKLQYCNYYLKRLLNCNQNIKLKYETQQLSKQANNLKDHLLTDNDRKLIKRYLETGECLDGFKVLLHRIRKNRPKRDVIISDLQLIDDLLKKAGETP